jgi:hypothetical protein
MPAVWNESYMEQSRVDGSQEAKIKSIQEQMRAQMQTNREGMKTHWEWRPRQAYIVTTEVSQEELEPNQAKVKSAVARTFLSPCRCAIVSCVVCQ